MQKLRTHIAKFFIVCLLWAGFGLYLVQPVKANSTEKVFSHWLNSVVQESDVPGLQKELDKLSDEGASLYTMIEYASRKLEQNPEDLRSVLQQKADFQKMYRMLLMGWNQFQNGMGMANVPPARTLKPATALQLDKYGTVVFPGMAASNAFAYPLPLDSISEDFSAAPIPVTPMEDSIAIGAP